MRENSGLPSRRQIGNWQTTSLMSSRKRWRLQKLSTPRKMGSKSLVFSILSLQTQVAQLAESMKRKSPAEFQKSYDETLSACNGCHTEAGYQFIHIVRPNAPPVTNQKWETSYK